MCKTTLCTVDYAGLRTSARLCRFALMARSSIKPVSTTTSRAEMAEERYPLEARAKPQHLANFANVAKTTVLAVETEKLHEIANLLWLPKGLDQKEVDARLVKAFDLFNAIQPADGLEAMLATQMVGTHSAAVECLRRAMLPEQTFEGRNQALSHAQRLMALYTKQLAALDKHRGQGQQKVTVEYVNVESGGQAIVGHVSTGESGRRTSAPPQITHAPAAPDPLEGLADTAPVGRARVRKPRG